MGDAVDATQLVPRLCHIVRWTDFNGYGFNLHAEKGKAGQFIGKVDEGSPAEAAGLKQGDRIVEVNGTNIGNENHQQVVARIKAGGDETRLLVVDQETDQSYKDEKKVIRGDLPEVLQLTAARDRPIEQEDPVGYEQVDTEMENQEPEPATIGSVSSNSYDDNEANNTTTNGDAPDESARYPPRLCNLCKWADFDGYGFNLHAEKDKPGQYIGSVDPDSPAETGGLKENDRIIEVNGDNIESQTHSVVIQKIKAGGERTSLLVVDREADQYYKSRGLTVNQYMASVVVCTTPPRTETETVTATTVETTESAPEPEPENLQNGTASNGINGGSESSVPEPEPTPVRAPEPEPEPEPAVIRSTTTITTETTPASGELNLQLSAAEMKERLKARKRQDPRLQKTSFEAKHKMFEKM